MAVTIHVVGQADMRQIERAQATLKRLEYESLRSSNSIAGGLTRFGSAAQTAGRSMQDFGSTLTRNVTLPLAAVGAGIYTATQAASDLAETTSKVSVVFGSSAKAIEAWATTADTKLGQSKQQAMDAAANFAIFGKSAGLSGGELVKFSTGLTGVAADMASFANTTPDEAIMALSAALRGESEPIRRYGVLLDDASMRQKALAMGLISTTKDALTPQQKVLAAQALIYEQLGAKGSKTIGDFARTSGGLANQQRIMQAQLKNLTAELGTAFMPILMDVVGTMKTDVLPALKSAVDWFKNLSPATQANIVKFGLFAAALGPVAIGVGKVVSAVGMLSSGTARGFLAISRGASAGLTAVRSLATGLGLATTAQGTYNATAVAMGAKIRTAITAIGAFVTSLGTKIAALAASTGTWIANTAGMVANKVAMLATAAATKVAAAAQWAMNAAMSANPIGLVVVAIAALVGALVYLYNNNETVRNALNAAWNGIKNAASAVWNWLVEAFRKWGTLILAVVTGPIGILVFTVVKYWDQIKAGAQTAWNAILNALRNAAQAIVSLFMNWTLPGLIIKHWDRIREGAANLWNRVVSFFRTGAQRIIDYFVSIAKRWLKVGQDIVAGIWNGIKSGWDSIVGGLKKLATDALNSVKDALGIASPSKKFMQVGQAITDGMAEGVKQGNAKVQTVVGLIASDAATRSWIAIGQAYAKNKDAIKAYYGGLSATTTEAIGTLSGEIDKVTAKAIEKGNAAVEKITKTLKDKLAKARTAFKDFSSSIADGITQGFTFSNALSAAAQAGEDTGVSFLTALDSKAQEAVQFGALIAKLVDAGLSEEGVSQIAAAGAEAGTRMANELLAGGAAAIAKANALLEAVALMAKSVGDKAATEFYGKGVEAAKGMLDGFLSATKGGGQSYKEIMAIMDQLVKDAERTIKLKVEVVMPDLTAITSTTSGGTTAPEVPAALVASTTRSTSTSTTTATQVTIAPGAVQVSVTGNNAAETETAINDAFDRLVQELRAM